MPVDRGHVMLLRLVAAHLFVHVLEGDEQGSVVQVGPRWDRDRDGDADEGGVLIGIAVGIPTIQSHLQQNRSLGHLGDEWE